MTSKEKALVKYLEFSLCTLVERIEPHLAQDSSKEEIYGYAYEVLMDLKRTIVEPSGLTSETK